MQLEYGGSSGTSVSSNDNDVACMWGRQHYNFLAEPHVKAEAELSYSTKANNSQDTIASRSQVLKRTACRNYLTTLASQPYTTWRE